jgi:3'-phosphoadenosine 5'-phosphosulfate sulfotransferase (PAPS reductase)/FAD synthetase
MRTASGTRSGSGPSCGTSSTLAGVLAKTIRVFPLSNWTEIDVWQYIHIERIPVVPLYFARERDVIVRSHSLILQEQPFVVTMPGETPQLVRCRMRSLGWSPCTGAIRSDADTVSKIIEELIATRHSERQLRIIDHDQDGSMEVKKREGYFVWRVSRRSSPGTAISRSRSRRCRSRSRSTRSSTSAAATSSRPPTRRPT